jgi:phospholipid/cholesterol/gamma-HCH transport system substrate-binding protein
VRFRIKFAQQIVGLFVVIAVAAAVVVLVLMGANQRWFARNYSYWSRFESARGLSVGMAITFKGFEIGKVTDVELTEDNHVDVSFYVQDTYLDKVTEDSVLQLTSSPIGIGGGLVFHQGARKTEPKSEGSLIPSWESEAGRSLREAGRVAINREEDAVARLLADVEGVLATLDSTLSAVDGAITGTAAGPVTDILVGVDELVASATATSKDLGSSVTGAVGGLERSVSATLAEIDQIARNLEQTSAALADPTGLVPRLLDPKGSVATLLDDDNRLYDSVESILASLTAAVSELNQIVAFLNETTPQISGLLEEGRQTLDTGQDVLEGIRNNPLIRRGVPQTREQPTPFQSIRDERF